MLSSVTLLYEYIREHKIELKSYGKLELVINKDKTNFYKLNEHKEKIIAARKNML